MKSFFFFLCGLMGMYEVKHYVCSMFFFLHSFMLVFWLRGVLFCFPSKKKFGVFYNEPLLVFFFF